MNKRQIINFFGSPKQISILTSRKKSAISKWSKNGVPADCQRIFYYMTDGLLIPDRHVSYVPIEEIQKLTKGKLKAGQ
ncbi:hypothetical protein [Francisella sp. SYW-9]|uniref:hypothetical protein n=1 Tax=Francisella sp. SYW-9 TaxID=2610888 RepID=UPI00123C9B3D|nr:hypothetical protein [Francisella sp. SYW-9]